jgi:hypothetical protein
MLTTVITLALLSQTPATLPPLADARHAAALAPAPLGRSTQADRIKARKAALTRQNLRREAMEAAAMRQAAIEQQKHYERMLPYLMEQQRQYLQRMSDIERNAALHKMADSMQMDSQTYQWQVWKQR